MSSTPGKRPSSGEGNGKERAPRTPPAKLSRSSSSSQSGLRKGMASVSAEIDAVDVVAQDGGLVFVTVSSIWGQVARSGGWEGTHAQSYHTLSWWDRVVGIQAEVNDKTYRGVLLDGDAIATTLRQGTDAGRRRGAERRVGASVLT